MPYIPRRPRPPSPQAPPAEAVAEDREEREDRIEITPSIRIKPKISIKNFRMPPAEAYRQVFGKEPPDDLGG